MLDKEINFISDFCLNKVKRLGAFFDFEKLKKADIHPAIVQYISAHLDFLIYEDRKKLLEHSAFDYTGKEIARYFTFINEEIKKNKRLTYEDVKSLVVQAVSFNANFLISPKWSLSRLVFEGKESLSIEEVRLVLNYSYYYDFIKSIFSAYLNKRHVYMITRDEFESLFDKIDREVFAIQPQQFIENTLYDLADFFNIGGVSKTKIPLFALEAFLKEKNLTDYVFRLKRATPLEPKPKYELAELRTILLSPAALGKQTILEPNTDNIPKELEAAPVAIEAINTPLEETVIDFKKEEQNIDELFEIQPDELAEVTSLTNTNPEPVFDDVSKVEDFILASNEDTVNEIIDYIESQDNPDEIISQSADIAIDEEESPETEIINEEESVDNAIEEKAPEEIEQTPAETDELFEEELINPEAMLNELMKDSPVEEPESAEEPADELEIEEQPMPVYQVEEEEPVAPLTQNQSAEDEIMSLLEEIEGRDPMSDFVSPSENVTNETEYTDEEIFIEEEIDEIAVEEKPAEEKPAEEKPEIDERTVAEVEEEETGDNEIRKDITDFISEKEASKIISSIFKDDNVDFIITLGKISKCKTFEEGTDILKTVFAAYKVDPYSRDAIKLTNIVADYFNL